MGVFRESVQEQPPSFSNSPAVPGLAEERAHAPEGRKRKVKERRAGTTMGAPRGCPGAPCTRSLQGRRGRTKAPAAPDLFWGRAGRRGCQVWRYGFVAALSFEVLCVWRSSASARRVCPAARPRESLRPRRERDTFEANRLFNLSALLSAPLVPVVTGASHLGVSLTPVPLASPGSPRGDSPGGAELATRLSTGSRRSPLSPAGD